MEYADMVDFASHGLLSEEASTLTPEQLEAQADLALDLMGLRGWSAGSKLDQATRLVALQVNYQVSQEGGAAFVLQSWSQGRRSKSFRDAQALLAPAVLSGLGELRGLGNLWPSIRSLR